MTKHSGSLIFFLCAAIMCAAQKKPMTPGEINRLLPQRLKGFVTKNSKATEFALGTISYSLAERVFVDRKKQIKALLFDYINAEIMLTQTARKWSEMHQIESDTLIFRKTEMEFGSRWEMFDIRNNHAQLVASIHNRFMLSLESEALTLEELKNIFAVLHPEQFP